MENNDLLFAIKDMLESMETRLDDKIVASEERMIGRMADSEGRMKAYIGEKIADSEERTKVYIGEKITDSEEHMKSYIGEKIADSEERTKEHFGVGLIASECRMREHFGKDLVASERRVKDYITANNVEIGTVLTEALETVSGGVSNIAEEIRDIKDQVSVLRVNDAQKTIDLVRLQRIAK